MSRRKLKGERELLADINKRFSIFCGDQECETCVLFKKSTVDCKYDCKYDCKCDCRIEYIRYLYNLYFEEE